MKELIQNKQWWESHKYGIGHFATHKAINKNNNNKRYFIGSIDDIEKYLGNNWNVFTI